MNAFRQRGTAAQLLDRVVTTSGLDFQAIADVMVVPVATLLKYRDGTLRMPVERQLCLARFTIEHVPALARYGRQLHDQIAATIAFQTHQTETHSGEPTPRWR